MSVLRPQILDGTPADSTDASLLRVLSEIGCCVVLLLIATDVVKILLVRLAPSLWAEARYLPLLLAFLFVSLVLAVVRSFPNLAQKTDEFVSAIAAGRTLAPVPALTVLAGSAMLFVAVADLGLEWLATSTNAPGLDAPTMATGWASNVLLLFCTYALVLAVSTCEQDQLRRRVPLLVSANFPLPRETPVLSLNALPSYLLRRLGVAPPGFLALTDSVRRHIPVFSSSLVATSEEAQHEGLLPTELQPLVQDYRLLQYDLLLGKQYSLRPDNHTY